MVRTVFFFFFQLISIFSSAQSVDGGGNQWAYVSKYAEYCFHTNEISSLEKQSRQQNLKKASGGVEDISGLRFVKRKTMWRGTTAQKQPRLVIYGVCKMSTVGLQGDGEESSDVWTTVQLSKADIMFERECFSFSFLSFFSGCTCLMLKNKE